MYTCLLRTTEGTHNLQSAHCSYAADSEVEVCSSQSGKAMTRKMRARRVTLTRREQMRKIKEVRAKKAR